MKILLYFLITLSFSCRHQNTSSKATKSFNSQNSSVKDTFDIKSLYVSDKIISPTNILGGFSLNHSKIKNEVKVISSKKVNDIIIQFVVVYDDRLSMYKKDSFFPGDTELPIIEAYFNINGSKTLINNSDSINVANIWFSDTEDESIKVFDIRNTTYVLIHGINLYCNGRQCNDDTIYSISVTSNGRVLVKAFHYNRVFPYLFDKIELVNSNKPFIFLPKEDVKKITKETDFDKYYLDY